MKTTDKFMQKLHHAIRNGIPASVTVNGVSCEMHLQSVQEFYDDGIKGGSISFYLTELDEDGYPKNSQQTNPSY